MRSVILGAMMAGLGAGASLAGPGITFEPVEPEGLSAERVANIVEFQNTFGPVQLAALEASGYGAYGAVAVPVATAGAPVFKVLLPSQEEAEAAALEGCAEQAGTDCTLIGLILPAAE